MNKPFELCWDLNADENIGVGLKLTNKNFTMKKHQPVHITYGERANSFLLVEYGFAIPDNRYDFVRRSNLNIQSFYGDLMFVSPDVQAKFDKNLSELALKSTL